jgi:hypothetical protein
MKHKLMVLLWSLALMACTPPVSKDLTIELLPGVDTVEVGSEFVDAGALAFLGETPQTVTLQTNTVDILLVGRYEIVYQAQAGGQIASITRVVDVIDTTPPVVALSPGLDTIVVDETWIDAGIIVSDNSLLPCTIVIEGAVASDIAGEYQIIYVVTDAYGNITRVTRYINVVFG